MQPASSGTSTRKAWSSWLHQMMSSYLGIEILLEGISHDNRSDLANLVRLRHSPVGLEVEDLDDSSSSEDVMASTDALLEPERPEQLNQLAETRVGVSPSRKDLQ